MSFEHYGVSDLVKFLREEARQEIILKARQQGKSEAMAMWIASRIFDAPKEKKNRRISFEF